MKSYMRLKFTNHALKDKFTLLAKHNFHLSKKDIKSVLNNPDHVDKISDYPNKIASKEIDDKHILRVIYRVENGIIKIITFYPAEKGRYY